MRINICYILDNSGIQIKMFYNSLVSSYKCLKPGKIYVILIGITEKELLGILHRKYNKVLDYESLIFIEYREIESYLKQFPELPRCRNLYLKSGALLRFYIPWLIQDNSVLYLDNDTLVYSDISSNFIDWEKYLMIGYKSRSIQVKDYINSGVLFLNLELWRNENMFSTVLKLYQENKDKIVLCNQDVYNMLPGIKVIDDETINTNTKYIERNRIKLEHFFGPGKFDYKNAIKNGGSNYILC